MGPGSGRPRASRDLCFRVYGGRAGTRNVNTFFARRTGPDSPRAHPAASRDSPAGPGSARGYAAVRSGYHRRGVAPWRGVGSLLLWRYPMKTRFIPVIAAGALSLARLPPSRLQCPPTDSRSRVPCCCSRQRIRPQTMTTTPPALPPLQPPEHLAERTPQRRPRHAPSCRQAPAPGSRVRAPICRRR